MGIMLVGTGLASTIFTTVLSGAATDSPALNPTTFNLSSLPAASLPAFSLAELEASAFQPLLEVVRPLIVKASLLVGGIFGIYIILILVRIHYERRNMKLLQQIRYDLDQQNYHYGIPSSQEKRGFWHRLIVDGFAPVHPQKHNTAFPSKPTPKLRRGK